MRTSLHVFIMLSTYDQPKVYKADCEASYARVVFSLWGVIGAIHPKFILYKHL